MTHQQGPCDLFYDPQNDCSFVPDLTPVQAEVVELLELNPGRLARPRLTAREIETVNRIVAWRDAA